MDNPPDSSDKHLYDMGMNVAKGRIDRSKFFICLVTKGTYNNQSILDQIEYAKERNKPFYLLIENGGQEYLNLNGADIRCREYFIGFNKHSLEEATKRILAKASQDFPGIKRFTVNKAPDLNGIVNWPPKT